MKDFRYWGSLALRSLLLVLAVVVPLLSVRHPPDFSDWAVYVEAGKKMASGFTVYDVVGHYQFKYAPLVAGFFAGLSHFLSLEALKWVNWGCELFIFVVFLAWIGPLRNLGSLSWWRFALFLGIVAALAIPLRDELKLGQLNLWCLLLLYGSWVLAHRAKIFWAALCLSLAVSLKLYALIFVPYWLFRRQWKFLGAALLFQLLLNFAWVAPWMGLAGALSENVAWVRSLTKSSVELVGIHADVSIFGAVKKVGWSVTTALMIWSIALVVFLKETWDFSRRAKGSLANSLSVDEKSYFGRAIAWILILNPLVWSYWSMFLLFVLLPAVENRDFGVGKIGIPRWLWVFAGLLLIVCVHRHNTPLPLRGVATGVLGIVLLCRPRVSPRGYSFSRTV